MSPFASGLEQPTQVKHPWRATARSAIQLLPMIGVTVPAIVDVVQNIEPGWVVGWSPVAIAGSLILTRVMALKPVNDLLTAVGMGATPKAPSEPPA